MFNALAEWLPQGAERTLSVFGGVLGAGLSFAFGDIGPLLAWLCLFVSVDFITGFMASWYTSSYQSKVLYVGIAKKMIMFCLVALSHGLDQVFEPMLGIAFFQSATICAYAAGEFGSIIENLERAGLGKAIPPVLRHLVKAMDSKMHREIDKHLGDDKCK